MKENRRDFIKKGASLAVALSAGGAVQAAQVTSVKTPDPKKTKWPVVEGPDTPKLCLHGGGGSGMPVENMQMYKQWGIDTVCMSGPRLPWTEQGIKETMDRFKAEGIQVINMMMNFSSSIIYGGETRDADIKIVQDSLVAAGAAGLPVVEYNFYAHRLTEGYYNVTGRGGSGYLGYDYNRKMPNPADNSWNISRGRSEDEMGLAPSELKAKPGNTIIPKAKLFENLTYFLKAVIPVAEKAGVVMALHPNDPPAPISRGNEQVMATFEDWKKMLDIVDSPSNGMTFDCGVSTEIGEDALEVLKYMAKRKRINHVHFRNVIVEVPATKYVETFPDNGTVNMFAVMQELIRSGYKYGIFTEHPRGNALDKKYGGDFISYLFNFAYGRGVFQSAMATVRG